LDRIDLRVYAGGRRSAREESGTIDRIRRKSDPPARAAPLAGFREARGQARRVGSFSHHHPLAGTKRGVDEVVAFFGQSGRAGFKGQTIFLEANDEWVVDLHRGWSEAGPGLDEMWALAFRIRDGKIAEAVNYPGNQHAADTFFWSVFRLKPLPDRLAT
jgi:uncharacterized protein